MVRASKCIVDIAAARDLSTKAAENMGGANGADNPCSCQRSNLARSLRSRTGRKQAAVTFVPHPVPSALSLQK